MNNLKVYQSTWPLHQLPATMKLFSTEWRFLLCADGKTPVDQIQRRLGLTEKERDIILTRLCDSNLLTEKSLTMEDFARTTVDVPTPSAEPQTFSDYVKAASTAAPAAEKTVPAFSPLQKPTASNARAMSLQSVIQFILNQNSDPTAGHLATYQVFMGINTQLLKRNGITSLRFQDDRHITDPELQAAIQDNIRKVLGKNCPDDVFSAPPSGEK